MLSKSLVAGALILTSVPSFAGGRQFQKDAQDVQDARAQRWDDSRDLWHAQNLLSRFDEARNTRNWRQLRDMEGWIFRTLNKEIREGRAEVERADANLRNDVHSARADRRQQWRAGYYWNGHEYVQARQDELHDRREARQDWNEAQFKRWTLAQKEGLMSRMQPLANRFDPGSLEQKRAVLVDLINLEENEVRRDANKEHQNERELGHDARQGGGYYGR